MSFIWDDSGWFLVDDEDSYDKSRFVVARKLCVKPSNDRHTCATKEDFSPDRIRQHTEQFGEIESIEILPNDEPEAHVTFVSSYSAYLMCLQHQYDKMINKKQPFEIQPAETWKQPSQNVNPPSEYDMEVDDEQTSEIFTLNEDCLLHLFKFLNLDSLVNMAFVCKLFNRLLRQHCFRRIRKYEVNSNDSTITLAKVRRTMLCIGQHITDLSYVDHDERFKYVYHRIFVKYVTKHLQAIAQKVGQNIRRAHLEFEFNENRIETIAPILRHLESLEIIDHSKEFRNDIDLKKLCPNLVELKVDMHIPMIACRKPWPSLRSLSVKNNVKLRIKTLTSIIRHNPQLTCLIYDLRIGPPLVFAKYSLRLESLTIYCSNGGSPFTGNFNGSAEFPRLCEINLVHLEANSLEGTIERLATFTNLRKISLHGCGTRYDFRSELENCEQPLVNLARKLSFLEELQLVWIAVKEETLVNIVRFGRQLKVLHFDSCKLVFSDELIFKLVDALKCYRQEFNETLQLYLNKWYFDKLDAVKNEGIERYLQLKCT